MCVIFPSYFLFIMAYLYQTKKSLIFILIFRIVYCLWFVIQVKMTDMQVRGTPRDMLPGDPYCAPLSAVLAEAYISLLRKLSTTDAWSRQVDLQ
jgi:hypothetical protein